jgi:DNA mismatch repair protein MutS
MEDARLARGLVRREVIRVLTPGTVVEEGMLAEAENNFLVAICDAPEAYGLAALDVSTGEFLATTLEGDTALEALQTELARLQPAECLLTRHWHDDPRWQTLHAQSGLRGTVCEDTVFDLAQATQRLSQQFGEPTLRAEAHTPLALRAAGAVLSYLHLTHKTTLPHLTCLRPYRLSQYLVLDAITRRNLELVRTMRQGERQGSLLEVLDETVTAMGARLLRRWLEQPLRQLETITARQEAVVELVADPTRRQHLRQALKGIADIERLLGRIACGTANARQLIALRQALQRLPHLRQALHGVLAPMLAGLRDACTGEEGYGDAYCYRPLSICHHLPSAMAG